jgi:hypothetical protein
MAVTRALAERFPGRVPLPLAVDVARRWMALAELGLATDEPGATAAAVPAG